MYMLPLGHVSMCVYVEYICYVHAAVGTCVYVCVCTLFPGFLSVSVRKSGRGPGIFSHMSDVRIERMVERV